MRRIASLFESYQRRGVRLALLALPPLLPSCSDGIPHQRSAPDNVAQVSSALVSTAWTSTVPMSVARQNHIAVLLQSGSVLVAGGHPGNNAPTSSAEVFNPTTGQWTTVGSMSSPRRLFGACTLTNGKVLVAGGNAGTGDVTSAELFDPSSNTWSATGSLSAAREDFSMTCLSDGRVLVAGGSGPSGLLSSAEVYNPVSGTWSGAGSMPAAVHTHGAVLLNDGRVLVAGGNNASGPVATAAIWSPATNAWTATGSMATTRSFYALTLLKDGRALAAGGLVNVLLATTNKAELYDPSSGTWSPAASLNTARYSGASASLDSGPIVIGGVNGGSPLATSESYDSVHNAWTRVATAYGAVNQTATALTSASVLVAGGNTGSSATTSAQTYGLLNVFAVYAQRSVTLGSSDHVNGGDVGVASPAPSTFGPQLVVGSSATVQTNHNLVAPSVSLGSGAQVGDVQTTALTNSGGTLGTLASYPTSLPALPLGLPTSSGGPNVSVPAFTITTLNPGNYGDVSVTGTLFLNAGTYTFSSVTMADQGHLAGVSGMANVAVAGTFHAGNSASISSPGSTPAGQLVISVAGNDSGTTPAFSMGTGAAVSAILLAPHGTLSIGASSIVTGAFAGFDVVFGDSVTINYQNGLPRPATTAGRQTVASYAMPPASPIIGPVPANTVLSLAVGLPLRNFSALQAVADAASDPNNPSYRHYLGPTDYATNYAPLANDYATLVSWAQANGFTVGKYPNNVLIDVTGTAAQIQQAFQVNLNYAARPDGSTFYGPDRTPTIGGLSLQVLGMSGVDNYVPMTPLGNPQPCAAGTLVESDFQNNFLGQFGPYTCAGLDGSNQSIGILMGGCGFNTSDITGFESNMGLSGVPAVQIQVSNDPNGLSPGCPACSGALAPPRPVDTNTECPIDVEMALLIAPKAQIIAFEGTNPDSILANMAANPGVKQFSTSFLWSPSGLTQTLLTVLAAQGQSFVTGSGDSGAYQPASASCTPFTTARAEEAPPTDIRSLNYVTVVGSVSMTSSGVLSGSNFSGGGPLPSVTIPTYQANVNNGIIGADSNVSTTNRNLPDVAMVGENVCEVVTNCNITPPTGQPCPAANLVSGQAATNPGTSLSAPMFAGIIALANQTGRLPGPLGFANPALYLARKATLHGYEAFTDVGAGATNTNSCSFAYQALDGYDLVTGLGVPTCGLLGQLSGLPTISLGVSGTSGGPLICIGGTGFTPGGSVDVKFSGIPGTNHGGGSAGCPVQTADFGTVTAATDGTVQDVVNEISAVADGVNGGGIPCCTTAEINNGTVSIDLVDNTTGLSATASMPARLWCETGATGTVIGAGCNPPAVTISYHQVGACNGDPSVSPAYSAGPNQAYVVFHIEDIDNSLRDTTFSFDPAKLFVQQTSRQDFFDSSLSIYGDLFGPFAAVPQVVSSGFDLTYGTGAFGAAIVTTTISDGASEANGISYLLGYDQIVTDPPVIMFKTNQSQTSFANTEDCSTLSPLH